MTLHHLSSSLQRAILDEVVAEKVMREDEVENGNMAFLLKQIPTTGKEVAVETITHSLRRRYIKEHGPKLAKELLRDPKDSLEGSQKIVIFGIGTIQQWCLHLYRKGLNPLGLMPAFNEKKTEVFWAECLEDLERHLDQMEQTMDRGTSPKAS